MACCRRCCSKLAGNSDRRDSQGNTHEIELKSQLLEERTAVGQAPAQKSMRQTGDDAKASLEEPSGSDLQSTPSQPSPHQAQPQSSVSQLQQSQLESREERSPAEPRQLPVDPDKQPEVMPPMIIPVRKNWTDIVPPRKPPSTDGTESGKLRSKSREEQSRNDKVAPQDGKRPRARTHSPSSMGKQEKGMQLFEERRRLIAEAEAAQEALECAAAAQAGGDAAERQHAADQEALLDSVDECQWQMRGSYEDQVLHIGLRHLDGRWNSDEESLAELPRRKNGSPLLLRERLFRELLSGSINLKSLSANDVGAAQGDLHHLTLQQLLRLRVQHLTFNPGGAHAATHTAFLSRLDGLVKLQLGRKATTDFVLVDPLVVRLAPLPDDSTLTQLGHDLLLLVALASPSSAGTLPTWWTWRLANSDRDRIFFDSVHFSCAQRFPEIDCGVAEVKEHSRRDPGGRLWLQWRIHVVKAESELSESALSAGFGGQEHPAISAEVIGSALQRLRKTEHHG